ncbi:hypothetical protein HYT23_02895 [Candidatus Pacearchaeota archaeon]|nr:hypothetical protein [Candidatus Pacearchaeota archaeon]
MQREIQYDNDDKGRFYLVDYQDEEVTGRVVLSDVHEFAKLCRHIEQNSRSYPGYVLKPVPDLHKKLLDEHKNGKRLEFTDRRIEMEADGKWPRE